MVGGYQISGAQWREVDIIKFSIVDGFAGSSRSIRVGVALAMETSRITPHGLRNGSYVRRGSGTAKVATAQGRCYSDYPPWRGFITYHHPTTGSVQLEAECQTEKGG